MRRSYEQLWADVQAAARSLLAIGTCHGDRIALWAPTSLEWTVVQYAAASIGAILVTLNPAYRHSELAFALQSAEVAVLVLGETFKAESMVAVAQDALRDAPCVRSLVVLGDDAPPGWLTWDAFRSAGQSAALGARLAALGAQLLPWDAVNIQYTSGTTGRPKAATLSHHNIVNNAAMVGGVLGYGPSDRVCIPVPLFHCFGQVMGNLACIAYGATAVYPAATFDAEATLAAVHAERCTSLYGVPSMFISQLEHPRFGAYDLSSLRTGIMAGSCCPAEVMRRVKESMHMAEVTICYGMTESSPVSFQTARDDPEERQVTTVGRVQPHLEARVVGADGAVVSNTKVLVAILETAPSLWRAPPAP